MNDIICPAFLESGGYTFRCSLPDFHDQAHFGYGARSISYAKGAAPSLTWYDNSPGSMGVFRRPADSQPQTPFDGQQVVPGDSTTQG